MRIGIQTGPVVGGSLGSEQRLKFRTIGDSVTIAFRLESFQIDSLETWSKEEVCRILIGETTKQCLRDHPWGLKEVGMIHAKGESQGRFCVPPIHEDSRFGITFGYDFHGTSRRIGHGPGIFGCQRIALKGERGK